MYNIPEDLLGNLIIFGIVIFVVIIKSIPNSKQKQKRRSKEAGPNYNNTFLGQTANNQTAYKQTAYKQTTNDKKTPGILRSLENALEQGIIEIQTLQTQHSQSDSARPASNRSNTVQSNSARPASNRSDMVQSNSVQTNYTRSNSSQSGSAKTSIQARKAQEDKKKQLKEHFGLPEGKYITKFIMKITFMTKKIFYVVLILIIKFLMKQGIAFYLIQKHLLYAATTDRSF